MGPFTSSSTSTEPSLIPPSESPAAFSTPSNLSAESPPASTELHWCIGPPLHASSLEILKTTDHDLANRAVALYRKRFSSIGLFENEVYPGIETALAQLTQDGHQLNLATSKPTVFATRIIDHFGLNRFFQSINGSELDGTHTDKKSSSVTSSPSKPSPPIKQS